MDYKNDVNLVKKLFLPLAIFLFSSAVISVSFFYKYQFEHINELSSKAFSEVKKDLKKKFDSDISTYTEFIKLISKDQKAIKFYKENNRDGLYNYYKPLYKKWEKSLNLSHFYFHKKDKVNFLRVHNYKKHSDLIKRITLNKSVKNKGLGAGVEFGISHNLTLRVVYPWFYKNEIIGYIELGKEIDYITPELAKMNSVDIVFTIKKDLISKNSYKEWLSHSKNNLKFKEMQNHYIIDSSLEKLEKEVYSILDSSENIIKSILVKTDEKWLYINSDKFLDASGKEIGKIFVIQDFTNQHKKLFSVVITTTLVILLLIVLLLIYYYILIKKEEIKIEYNQGEYIHMSIVDSLTGLYNRRYFDNYLEELLNDPNNTNRFISLIIADIDNFKKYNDTYGHSKGDVVLKKVASTIKNSVRRADDKCFRIGGEEFAVILISDIKEIGDDISNSIRINVENLNIEHINNENYKKVTLSLGVNTIETKDVVDIKSLFESTDKLLYKSKETGRNRVTGNI